MDIIHMHFKILLFKDRVFPITPLPYGSFMLFLP